MQESFMLVVVIFIIVINPSRFPDEEKKLS